MYSVSFVDRRIHKKEFSGDNSVCTCSYSLHVCNVFTPTLGQIMMSLKTYFQTRSFSFGALQYLAFSDSSGRRQVKTMSKIMRFFLYHVLHLDHVIYVLCAIPWRFIVFLVFFDGPINIIGYSCHLQQRSHVSCHQAVVVVTTVKGICPSLLGSSPFRQYYCYCYCYCYFFGS